MVYNNVYDTENTISKDEFKRRVMIEIAKQNANANMLKQCKFGEVTGGWIYMLACTCKVDVSYSYDVTENETVYYTETTKIYDDQHIFAVDTKTETKSRIVPHKVTKTGGYTSSETDYELAYQDLPQTYNWKSCLEFLFQNIPNGKRIDVTEKFPDFEVNGKALNTAIEACQSKACDGARRDGASNIQTSSKYLVTDVSCYCYWCHHVTIEYGD